MSAPDTNIKKQRNEHKPALSGIVGGLIVVAGLFVAYLGYTAYQGGTPVTPEEQTRWGNGDPVENQPTVTPEMAVSPALEGGVQGAENDLATPMQNDAMTDSQTMTPGAARADVEAATPDTTQRVVE
ncbi:hypothetical protein [Rhodalgimonas zhirmunskyi]|uniref:Uncharacterized protein n=1 Tax=Rhodalgimonas zhirmunskyi TaxID=2964767 RepID=A0AAJ1X5N3_9RHOB|nr:hypothetical protein [Rhodoalgimonas zhirmunskyi]MDQ2095423.1 hypothetical protein [Rhodoalgimonas zhirmunskyi]